MKVLHFIDLPCLIPQRLLHAKLPIRILHAKLRKVSLNRSLSNIPYSLGYTTNTINKPRNLEKDLLMSVTTRVGEAVVDYRPYGEKRNM
jgi:hypothetical protein